MKAKFVYKGGPGSGHHGHGGRPGKQGGSLPGNESQGGHDSPFTASEMSADARAMRRMTEELDRQRADEKKKRKAEGDLEEASRKRDAKGVLDASRAIDEIVDSLSMKKTSSIDGGKSVIYQTRAKFSDIKKVLTDAGWTRLSDAGINTFTLDVKGRTLFAEAKRNGNRYDIQIDSYDE